MRKSLTRSTAATLLLAVCCATAAAQFRVRELNVDGETIDGHYEAYTYVTSPADMQWVEDSGFASVADFHDFAGDMPSLNLGSLPGAWPTPFNGDFLLGRDYVIDARADVKIPAGTWTIAFNTDDGGQLTIPGANFADAYGVSDPLGKGGPDQIWHQANRNYGSTGATFTVGAGGLTSQLHATMHQRADGSRFELVVRPGGPGNSTPAPGVDGWALLSSGAHGWEVTPTDELPALGLNGLPSSTAGVVISPGDESFPLGDVSPSFGAVITTTGDGLAEQPGLHQRWYKVGNGGDLASQLGTMAAGDATSTRFHDAATWWDGNSSDSKDLQEYPAGAATGGFQVAEGSNNDGYSTWLSGEINLSAGTTRFRSGIEDYQYVAIDTGGNGVAGDQSGEVLFDNNLGLGSRASVDGASLASVALAEVASDGWYKIEVITGEDAGGDAAVLYWDEGFEDNFPLAAPFGDASFAPADYAVPTDRLRSVTRGDIDTAMLVASFDGAEINLEVSSSLLDADRLSLLDPSLSTVLDLSGATINVTALNGETLSQGDQWVLFAADSVVGLDQAVFNVPDGMDVTGLLAGTTNRIAFGQPATGGTPPDPGPDTGGNPDPPAGVPGDLNGDGAVGFPDFLILSNNFGKPATGLAEGDIDGDGTVGFADFLVFSNNFGSTGGAVATVPEPCGLAPLGLVGLLAGLFRRRR